MSKMNSNNTELYFASLKFIEQLFIDGHIPDYMFKNILKDAEKSGVDITRFKTYKKETDGGSGCTV